MVNDLQKHKENGLTLLRSRPLREGTGVDSFSGIRFLPFQRLGRPFLADFSAGLEFDVSG